MKTVLIGANGQLAHDLLQTLPAPVTPLTRAELELEDEAQVNACLETLRPEVVVNTAAYNLVDKAECEPQAALAVNYLGARNLARACQRLGALLVHFSTDYVFGLEMPACPWTEEDPPGPVSTYGLSKLAGEYAVRSECERHLVLRTCGLYGVKGSRGKGGNFVETMLRIGQPGATVKVVHDQHCTPSFTHDVALLTAALLQTGAQGLFHATNSGGCSWHQFAKEIFTLAKREVECIAITSQEFNAPARRPPYSVLANDKLQRVGVTTLPDWQDALTGYLRARLVY